MPHTYEQCREMAEQALNLRFAAGEELPQKKLAQAMRYSLLAGGKRIRPALVMMFCEAAGGSAEAALPVAEAVEMLHTYSLIHDDLPCMDNDTLRRGKPTNHVVFGEYTATLAGDALQAEAFGTILRADLPAQVRADCAESLACAAGLDGICGGQQLDMDGDGKVLSEQELTDIQSRKTGSLLASACDMGAIVGGATEQQRTAALQFGAVLGAAFQIRDDMLDVIADEDVLGKNIGSDEREGKSTFVTLWGLEKCRSAVSQLTEYAKEIARGSFADSSELERLADMLTERVK